MGVILRSLATPAALRVSLWLLLLAVIATTKTDPDLWGHVRFGIDIIRDGAIPQTDAYSFTSDRTWVNHEWAAEVVTAAAHLAAGNAGLVLLKVAVVLSVLLLLNGALARQGVAEARHRDLLVAAAVITTIEQAHHVRPQIFSLACFATLLWTLVRARENVRWLWILPLLFCAWANLHGGWIVGGGVLALWTLGLAAFSGSGVRGAAPYLAAGVASLVATLINPDGFGLLAFLRETVGFGRADIVDWQPIYALGPGIAMLWILTAALAIVGISQRHKAPIPVERVVITITLAVMSFRVNRLISFFALATLFLLGPAIASVLRSRTSHTNAPTPRRAAWAIATVALMLSIGALHALATSARCIQVDSRTTPEAGAVEFLKARHSAGRLLVWFDWGQYALWHLSPDLRVSIDGRRETVYSAALQDRHLRFYFDAPNGATLPTELAADYVWIPKDLPAARRLATSGWHVAYSGEQSVVLARRPIAIPAALSTPTAHRCFGDR